MQNSAFEAEVLRLTNQFRQQNGLKSLVIDQSLEKAADQHTQSMANQDFFNHTGQDGSRPWDRAQRAGYESGFVGENIAAGYRTPKEVVDGWINSPGHRANMLNPDYNEIGIGHYFLQNDTGNVNYNNYWTQVFGKGTLDSPTPTPTPAPTPTPTPAPTNQTVLHGTRRNDRLIGNSSNQTLFGKEGNDYLQGKGGNDIIHGGKGKDRAFGGDGNDRIHAGAGADKVYGNNGRDVLFGGEGNDYVTGQQGNDYLVGVNPKNSKPGRNERDILEGGAGADKFVLGSKSKVYYDDHRNNTLGQKGYALLRDFKLSQGDKIILHGNKGDYRLGSTTVDGRKGKGIFLETPGQDELIALVQNGQNLSLNSNAFQFVA